MRATRHRLAAGMVAGLLLMPVARANGEDAVEPDFLAAAVTVLLAERLSERCGADGDASLAGSYAAWRQTNRADDLQAALTRTMRTQQGGMRHLATAVDKRASSLPGSPCQSLATLLRVPEGDLRARYPQAYANDLMPKAEPSPTLPQATTPAIAEIRGYGLIATTGFGYGGMLTMEQTPVVLFRDGLVLLDMEGLLHPGGAAVDRQQNPEHWSRWRQQDGRYEYQGQKGKWHAILNNKVWTELPQQELSGRFIAVGGGGDAASGGTTAIYAETSYSFAPGNRLERRGMASARSEFESGGARTHTTSRSNKGPRPGRYWIEGLELRIAYDDGGTETRLLMTYPSDPDIIWLDGTSYLRAKR